MYFIKYNYFFVRMKMEEIYLYNKSLYEYELR